MSKFFFTIIGVFLGVSLFAIASVAEAATLKMSPSTGTMQVGSVFTVTLILDTQGAGTDGVDVHYLRFLPAFLEVQGTAITPGTLFPNTTTNVVNAQTGMIDFSQISSGGTQYFGQGTLATIQFKPLQTGTANITFDFTQNATTDTNVSSFGSDVLLAVTNAQFTITAVPPPPDTTPPVISALAVTEVTQTEAKINWTTDESATYIFYYGTAASYGTTVPGNTPAFAHTVTISNLAPATVYHFKITVSDTVGNNGETSDQTFSTQSPPSGGGGGGGGSNPPITPPRIPPTTPPPTFPAVTGVAQEAEVASVLQAPIVKTDVGNVRLVNAPHDPKVYLLKGGLKVWIPNEKVFLASGFKWNQVQLVSASALNAETVTTNVIKSPIDRKVYEINPDGTKTWISNESTFFAKGYKWSEVIVIPTPNVLAYAEKSSAGGKVIKIASPAYSSKTASGKVVTVNAPSLNVRSGAGTENPRIAGVLRGQLFTVLAEKNGWLKIEVSGTQGWISADYVK